MTQKRLSELRPRQSNSSSGVRGVSWHTQRQAWRGKVVHHGRSLHIGYFDSVEVADAAVRQARAELFVHLARVLGYDLPAGVLE